MSSPKIILNKTGNFQLIDDNHHTLQTFIVQKKIEKYKSYFENSKEMIFFKSISYLKIEELLTKINKSLKLRELPTIKLSEQYNNYIKKSKYYIDQQKDAGLTIKNNDSRWNNDFNYFCKIVSQEISRPLKDEQKRASFFLAKMKRAANFSVPGAGKTAMMYGTYAYLSSSIINKVNKILVICPLNAFAAWRDEFKKVFGNKRQLNYMDLKDKRYKNNDGIVKLDWSNKNVIVLNYESLQSKLNLINLLIDEKTMIVFDEVHRIKGIASKRAKAALNISKKAYYRYVLTGTPIPNGYQDIFNFLNIMYPDEYSMFFKWHSNDLKNIDPDVVNKRLKPFFWRTTKKDLNVPLADSDNLIKVNPSLNQENLAHKIYENEPNVLARYIRLLQASTNPSLLKNNINYDELGLLDNIDIKGKKSLSTTKESNPSVYKSFDLDNMCSTKFNAGIKLIKKLVNENKKVLVWGMFIKTMDKIHNILDKLGIKSTLVYGQTPKLKREDKIKEVLNGNSQVLISNPNTLGESVSLHSVIHDAIYFEYNFNLTFMLQSRDRIHRLGLSPNQYTRYYYLMTNGTVSNSSFIDSKVYERLKEKEKLMLSAIEGELLVPEYTDDYLDEVKRIVN